MKQSLRAALKASLRLERELMAIAEDARLTPQERGARIQNIIAAHDAQPLAAAWAEAGRPAPLGFSFNPNADHSEWFDAWVEVESVVLDGEATGYSRRDQEAMILNNEQPFDLEFEAEDLGIIFRANEPQHTD